MVVSVVMDHGRGDCCCYGGSLSGYSEGSTCDELDEAMLYEHAYGVGVRLRDHCLKLGTEDRSHSLGCTY